MRRKKEERGGEGYSRGRERRTSREEYEETGERKTVESEGREMTGKEGEGK